MDLPVIPNDDHRKLGLRFHDLCRLRSHLVTRAFSSAIRASSEGAQSEMVEPDEVTLLESDTVSVS